MARKTLQGEMYRAGPPSPGARLLAAAALVRPGVPVADIGCDHGKLAVYLAMACRAPLVVAVDKNPLPLARAKALVRQTGTEAQVHCRLGSGLAPVHPGEVRDVVIAGMSGETMIEILQAAPWVQNGEMQFVFVPATRGAPLRRWLLQKGFCLLHETPVEDRGFFYTAIQAGYTGAGTVNPAPLLCELGLVAGQHSAAAAGYIRQRLAYLQKRLLAPMDEEQQAALQALAGEVEACLA